MEVTSCSRIVRAIDASGISPLTSAGAVSAFFSNSRASGSVISSRGATLQPANICQRWTDLRCASKMKDGTPLTGERGSASSSRVSGWAAAGWVTRGTTSPARRQAPSMEKRNSWLTVRRNDAGLLLGSGCLYGTHHYNSPTTALQESRGLLDCSLRISETRREDPELWLSQSVL